MTDALMTTAEAVVESLLRHGMTEIYALPGLHSDPLFDALYGAHTVQLPPPSPTHCGCGSTGRASVRSSRVLQTNSLSAVQQTSSRMAAFRHQAGMTKNRGQTTVSEEQRKLWSDPI